MLDSFGTPLSALVAVGGNSRAARSARAHLQWRDRYGRFIDMGKGIKFKIRLPDGTVRSVNGKFVGAIDGDTGQVYVQNDPSGLKDGFYNVHSANAQEILGSLDDATLAKRGINIGKDTNGVAIPDRSDEEIPNVGEVPFSDAPAGWKRLPDRNGAQVWETEDGDYHLYHSYTFQGGKGKREVWGVEDVRRLPGKQQGWKDIGFALKSVDNFDKIPQSDGNDPAAAAQKLKDDNAAAKDKLDALNDSTVPLAQRLGEFDPTGEVANLVNSGAPGDDILDALRKNPAWVSVENDLNHPADIRSADQKHKDSVYESLRKEVLAHKAGDAPAQPANPNAPEEPAADASAPDASAPDAGAPATDGADAGLDTSTFGVAQEGFLVPTGKSTTDGSPAGLASFVEANKDYLTEVSGKRILATTDDSGNVSGFEIANSSPTLDDAKAQAGGAGAPEFYDVAANKVVTNDKNLNNPASKEGQGAQDSNSPAGESKPDDTGSDNAVGNPDAPEAGDSGSSGSDASGGAANDSASGSADSADASTKHDALGQPIPADKHGLDQRLAYLNRAADRVSPDSPKFDDTLKAQKQIQDAVDNFKEPDANAPEKPKEDSAPEANKPDAKPEEKKAEATTPASDSSPKEDKPAEPAKPEDKPAETVGADGLSPNASDESKRIDELEQTVADLKKSQDDNAPAPSEPAKAADPAPQPTETSPAPAVPATDSTPEVPAAPESVPETPVNTLPDPSTMSWNDLNRELGVPIDPKSKTLSEDLARYEAVQREFFQVRGGFSNRPKNPDEKPSFAQPAPAEPVTPAEAPAVPDAPDAPAETPSASEAVPESAGDGLPDDVPALEALAARMETQLSNTTSPAREKVLGDQLDKVYSKIDSLSTPTPAPEPDTTTEDTPAVETPAPNVADEPDVMSAEDYEPTKTDIKDSISKNIAAGKDLTPEQQQSMSPDEIAAAPNKANTVTAPRSLDEQPNLTTKYSQGLVDEENDPDRIVDPNLIMADVRKNHPGHYNLENGDVVVHTTTDANGNKYEVVVRRTDRERFFTYILETDKNGNRRASRIGYERHSYDTLRKAMGRGKNILNNKDAKKWMNRQGNRENLPAVGDLPDGPASDFIDGTDLPKTPDETYNKVAAGIAELATDSNTPRHFLDAMGAISGLDPKHVDAILESVNRRKLMDAQAQIAPANVESHLDYNGTKLQPGDYVDWTDDKLTRPVKDANGNTVYEKNEDGSFVIRYGKKVAVNEPNPNYGKVFRGRVVSLRERTEANKKNVYSDSTWAIFPDLGGRSDLQRQRISSQLRIADGADSPIGEPFFARKQEKRVGQENVVAGFGLPTDSSTITPRPQAPAPRAVEAVVDPETGINAIPGFEDVNLPDNKIDAAKAIDGVPGKSSVPADLQAGDVLVSQNPDGTSAYETVLDVQPNELGNAHVRTARVTDDGHEVHERDLPPVKVLSFRPAPAEAPVNKADKPLTDLAIGDTIHAEGLPEEGAVIKGWTEGLHNERDDWMFAARTADGETYYIRGDEVYQRFAPEAEPIDAAQPAWHRDPATAAQLDFIRNLAVSRKLSDSERGDITKAVTAPGFNKKDASDLIDKFKDRKRAPVRVEAQDDLVDALKQRLAADVRQQLDDIAAAKTKALADLPIPKSGQRASDSFADNLPDAPDPKALERMNARGQKIVDAFNEGNFSSEGDGSNGVGIMHSRAEIVNIGGDKYFVKGTDAEYLDGPDGATNEILSNRVLQAIGIDDVQMGRTGDSEVIMTLVPGEMAWIKQGQKKAVFDNFWDNNGWKIGVFDFIASNNDRNEANWMIRPDGQPVPIDHATVEFDGPRGWSSPFADRLMADLRKGNAPLTTATLLRIKSALMTVQPEFTSIGGDSKFDAMIKQLDNLIERVKN